VCRARGGAVVAAAGVTRAITAIHPQSPL
jgi:hypothetical protein